MAGSCSILITSNTTRRPGARTLKRSLISLAHHATPIRRSISKLRMGRALPIVRPASNRLGDILVEMTQALHQETKLPDLCLGGGVALNGVANARILAESGFERIFVPPAPGDAGCAMGAALYVDRVYFGNPHRDVPDH